VKTHPSFRVFRMTAERIFPAHPQRALCPPGGTSNSDVQRSPTTKCNPNPLDKTRKKQYFVIKINVFKSSPLIRKNLISLVYTLDYTTNICHRSLSLLFTALDRKALFRPEGLTDKPRLFMMCADQFNHIVHHSFSLLLTCDKTFLGRHVSVLTHTHTDVVLLISGYLAHRRQYPSVTSAHYLRMQP
jgi:hypothetical protein